jgi:formate hydrogenlyase subunit 3/multisubunit Na+/H+ antiporter MnhD subunit
MPLSIALFAALAALLSSFVALCGGRREALLRAADFFMHNRFLPLARSYPALSARVEYYFDPERFARASRVAPFALLGLSGCAALAAGLLQLSGAPALTGTLPFGLPWLSWHVRIDALSGFFLCVLGLPLIAVSLFGPGYAREFAHRRHALAVLGLFTGLFVAGMELVLLADDAFFFMITWELMSVASYFLVAFQHEQASNRRAAFLYLLMAEIGAIFIILAFGVLAGFSGEFTFAALHGLKLSPAWASIAFVLALFGFGMKAGLVPVHVWLPEAHPAAPSHVSALMSGVMLKVAIYGFIRFSFDLLQQNFWQWGVLVLSLGAASSVLGILYALQQPNLKRLLAYSSVENVGIIFTALGLSLIFFHSGQRLFGALGLLAALLHCFNHALFKTLLFLGAGAILHQTHEISLEKMGGLIHRMPKLAAIFLVGILSISALPPLNGFVSEWLILQTALQAGSIDSGVLRSLIPTAAAVLALTGALGVACFIKVYGIAFLGLPRSQHIAHAHETDAPGMLAGPALLAACCVLFGIFPAPLLNGIRTVVAQLSGETLPNITAFGWLWVTPIEQHVSSYSPLLVLAGMVLVGGLCYYWLIRRRHIAPRRAEPWDCGFGGLNARMQYTSGAFSMPVRRIFKPLFEVRETVDIEAEGPSRWRVRSLRHRFQVLDKLWPVLYAPAGNSVVRLARKAGRIQTGSVRTYIGYSFFTLIFLLWVVS